MKTERNYGLLRNIALVLRIISWVALAVGVIGAIVVLTLSLPGGLKFGLFLVAIIAGICWFIQLYAAGSVLVLLMDTEENTREMASLSES